MLEIIKYPNQILRQKGKNVADFFNDEIIKFIENLKETMFLKDGLGLAAPQVGQSINIIAVRISKESKVFINPRIIWKNLFKKNVFEEGCLSFPNIYGLVKRPKAVCLMFRDQDGKLRLAKFQGLLATVVQHEIDHLRGRLFIDRVFKYTKGENKLKELRNQGSLDEK